MKQNVDLIGEKRVTSNGLRGDFHIEKTRKKAEENTMMERLEGDEGIEQQYESLGVSHTWGIA